MDLLGFLIDSIAMTLTVPPEKVVSVNRKIKQFLAAAAPTTLDAARVAGRLISLEPAAPLISLLVRPLFNVLTATLVAACCVDSVENMPKLERERDAEDNYCWRVVPLSLSAVAREALSFICDNWKKINGVSLVTSLPTLLIRTDASQDGGGITLWKVEKKGTVKFIERFFVGLEPDQMLLSSTEREAIVLSEGFSQAERAGHLKGAVVEGVVDNQPITDRFTNGSSTEAVQQALLSIAKVSLRNEAVWQGMWWARRYLMQSEDDISKERQIELAIEGEWFLENIMGPPQKTTPNIDLFASPSDRVLNRFATMQVDPCGPECEVLLDGLRVTLLKKDVPWIFPPIPMITKALKHWLSSWSRSAFFVLPKFSCGRFTQEVKRVMLALDGKEVTTTKVWDAPVIVERPPREDGKECLKHIVIFATKKGGLRER
jgi:hypothetical protein